MQIARARGLSGKRGVTAVRWGDWRSGTGAWQQNTARYRLHQTQTSVISLV